MTGWLEGGPEPASTDQQLPRIHRQGLPCPLWGTYRLFPPISFCVVIQVFNIYKATSNKCVNWTKSLESMALMKYCTFWYSKWLLVCCLLNCCIIFVVVGGMCPGHQLSPGHHQEHWVCNHWPRLWDGLDQARTSPHPHGQEGGGHREWTLGSSGCRPAQQGTESTGIPCDHLWSGVISRCQSLA